MNNPFIPVIRKADRIVGRTLVFRNATIHDAEYILSLRTNEKNSAYLSLTPPDVEAQRAWLSNYELSNDQAYFIISSGEQDIGTVRLYDARGESFCWGSWILEDRKPPHAAMESVLMVYAYAIHELGFQCAHFEVRKGNEHVWKFHERFGAIRQSESSDDYHYAIDRSSIDRSLARYSKCLPMGVSVERGSVRRAQ